MRRRISLGLCFVILAGSAYAATVPSICGEWTGSRPPKGTTRPNEQKWILTFRPDNSFSLGLVEGTIPVPGVEGSYKATSSNIVLQLPNAYPVTMAYSIQGKDLKIEFSKLTTMLGSGDGVEKYVRTKEVKELATQQKQKLLNEGRYKLTVTLAKDNEEIVLKEALGDQYKLSLSKPIDGGTFPLHQLQGRNIIQLPGEGFGPPEFNGDSFKVFGAVAPKVNGNFSGKVCSSTKIEGTFKSRSTTLHGTFTLERTGSLEQE